VLAYTFRSPNAVDAAGKVEDALGLLFDQWRTSISNWISFLFSGSVGGVPASVDSSSLSNLWDMMDNGKMIANVGQLNVLDYQKQAESLVYGKLIPYAWAVGSTKVWPFILETTNTACSGKADGQINGFMSDTDAAATCYMMNGKAYYLLNAAYRPESTCYRDYCGPVELQLQALPGGTASVMPNWGNVQVGDVITSSYKAFQNNNNKNVVANYDITDMVNGGSKALDLFGVNNDGLQVAGLFNLPICTSDQFANVIAAISGNKGAPSGNFWPCS
jgi:hypothetical protein